MSKNIYTQDKNFLIKNLPSKKQIEKEKLDCSFSIKMISAYNNILNTKEDNQDNEELKEIHKTDAITITFGDQAENHAGMQKIGKSQKDGFTIDELKHIKENMESKGLVCEMINLNDALDEELKKQSTPASVLIIRGLMNAEGMSADELFHQLKTIKWDSFLVSTRTTEIQNKLARANLCFSDAWDIPEYTQEKYEEHKDSKVWQHETLSQIYEAQQDYREQLGDRRAKLTREEVFNAKGTVVKWETFGELNKFKQFIESNFGKHANKLVAEGNSYVNYKKCGIGYHGDSERMIVIAIRLGKSFPMHFQWYKKSERIGKNIILPELKHGDVYIMSEKAVGKDWSLRSKITLRHAAGCPKYVN